jgi:hypothetical protein
MSFDRDVDGEGEADASGANCQRCHTIFRDQKTLSRIRQSVLMTRTHLGNERKRLKPLREKFREKQSKCLNLLNDALSRGIRPEDYVDLEELNKHAQDSYNDLCMHQDYCSDLENKLSNLEYQMDKRESTSIRDAFYAASGTVTSGESVRSRNGHRHNSHSSGHNSSETVHPLVQAYYDSAGNVTVLRERVQEYDFSHKEAVRSRNKKSKSGQPVNPPDKVFWVTYFRERRALIQSYLKAKIEAQRLKQLCIELRYDIEDDDDDISEIQQRALDNSKRVQEGNADTSLGVSNGSRPLELLLFGSMDSEEYVQDWLKGTLRPLTSIGSPFLQPTKPQSEGSPDTAPEIAPEPSQARTEPQHALTPTHSTLNLPSLSPQSSKPAAKVLSFSGELVQRRYSNPEIRRIAPMEIERPGAEYARSVF